MNVRTRTAALALAAAPLALALVACGGDDGQTRAADPAPVAADVETTDSVVPPATTTDTTTATASPDDDTVLAAARTALAELDGTVFAIDRERGGWDVTVVTADGPEHDLLVSLDGATVERGPVADRDGDAEDRAERQTLLAETKVDLVAAVGLARAEVPGSPVDSVELDLDGARAVWEVQLGLDDAADQHDVTIDAVTGAVLRTERDD